VGWDILVVDGVECCRFSTYDTVSRVNKCERSVGFDSMLATNGRVSSNHRC
jgi:hypothetical protein